jgi:hypothetical protein
VYEGAGVEVADGLKISILCRLFLFLIEVSL